MRSMTERSRRPRVGPGRALLALLALCGCGTWSNEDLRFLEALPTRPELHVEVPVTTAAAARLASGPEASQTVAACALGSADPWLKAKATSDGINASIDWVLSLIDAVRRTPPTSRLVDGRVWGPFDDSAHPGNEIEIVILRTFPADLNGLPEYEYAFEARSRASGQPFTPVLSGTFIGPSAQAGTGTVGLDFDAIWQLGMADSTSPRGTMSVKYDRAADPRTVELVLAQATQAGFGLEQFNYHFAGYADGRGRFDYAFRQAVAGGSDLLEVYAGFDAQGAGRGEVRFQAASGASGTYDQCWDASACLLWSSDPTGYLCGGTTPCASGDESACPSGAPAPVSPP
jgi:hypothetical protein